MVLVARPACGTDVPVSVFEKCGFSFQRCPTCRTVYMSRQPSEAAIADYCTNSESPAYWAKHIFPASEASRRENIHNPLLDRVTGQTFLAEQGLSSHICRTARHHA